MEGSAIINDSKRAMSNDCIHAVEFMLRFLSNYGQSQSTYLVADGLHGVRIDSVSVILTLDDYRI